MHRTKLNVIIAYADTQEILKLPDNVRRVRVTPLSNVDVRFAFNAGYVEDKKGFEVLAGQSKDTGPMSNAQTSIYLLSFLPGALVQIEAWAGAANEWTPIEFSDETQPNAQLRSLPAP